MVSKSRRDTTFILCPFVTEDLVELRGFEPLTF